MSTLTYSVADFLPFTKIISADVNTRFSDIRTLINTTGLTSSNIQQYGLTRDRLAQTSANHALINDSSGTMSSEAQLAVSRGGIGVDLSALLTTNAGNAVIVNSGGTAYTLGAPTQTTITESFSGVVSSLTAGASIAANDACAIDIGKDTSGNTIYRVFKADYTVAGRRRSFLGFAQAAATVTAGVYTWVASANFVTSNSIAFNINGRAYTVAFTTDNATTLQAVATAMATDPDVNGAVSDGSHTVTITGKGGLTIYLSANTVTGGASQATITTNTTTLAAGQNVLIQCFGPLTGFVSLTTAGQYYLNTGGGITLTPADTAPIQVGQALSSTVLFISTNQGQFQFGTPSIFVRSHGTPSDATSATQDVEHFNFTSWVAGTASAVGARLRLGTGDSAYQGFHHELDGHNTAGSGVLTFQKYNKASWSTLTNRAAVGGSGGAYAFNGFLYAPRASASIADKWNGASWTTATTSASVTGGCGNFVQGSLLHSVGGTSTNTHNTLNSSDTGATSTVFPISGYSGCASTTLAAGYAADGGTTNSYRWSGSWSSGIVMTYKTGNSSTLENAASGYNTANNLAVVNGGNTVSGTSVTTSATFNDTAWAASVASSNARGGGVGSVI